MEKTTDSHSSRSEKSVDGVRKEHEEEGEEEEDIRMVLHLFRVIVHYLIFFDSSNTTLLKSKLSILLNTVETK
jgi:hypothetical protein